VRINTGQFLNVARICLQVSHVPPKEGEKDMQSDATIQFVEQVWWVIMAVIIEILGEGCG
jgi:hypothetical protein